MLAEFQSKIISQETTRSMTKVIKKRAKANVFWPAAAGFELYTQDEPFVSRVGVVLGGLFELLVTNPTN